MTTTTTPVDNKDAAKQRDDALKASYQKAMKRLREEHLTEFNQFRVEEAKALGIEWTPPKTDEEKAAEEYAALVARYPGLAEKFKDSPVASVPNAPVEEPVEPTATRI